MKTRPIPFLSILVLLFILPSQFLGQDITVSSSCSISTTNFNQISTSNGRPYYINNEDGDDTELEWSNATNTWNISILGVNIILYQSSADTPTPPNTATGNWVRVSNFASCDNISVEGPAAYDSAMPVSLTAFNGQANDKNVTLSWATATEANNEGFEVQRSANDDEWASLGFVDAQVNTSLGANYAYTDERPLSGRAYYRLKQIDHDGSFQLSEIISVISRLEREISLFPNPAGSTLYLRTDGQQINQPVTISSVNGQVVTRQSASVNGRIDLSALRPGTYLLQLATEAGLVTRKFVRQ